MAIVAMIEETGATGVVKEVYEDIKNTRGIDFVPNFWKTIANHPPTLKRTWRSIKEVMAPGALDPVVKEMIAVAVSATNGCEYCTRSHTAQARLAGMSEEMLGELMAVVGMFNETNRLADGYRVDIDEFLLDSQG